MKRYDSLTLVARLTLTFGAVEMPFVDGRPISASGAVDESSAVLSDPLATSYPSTPVACNQQGQCLLLNAGEVDDGAFGRTTRLFKRFFGEARHRGVRR